LFHFLSAEPSGKWNLSTTTLLKRSKKEPLFAQASSTAILEFTAILKSDKISCFFFQNNHQNTVNPKQCIDLGSKAKEACITFIPVSHFRFRPPS